MKIINFFKIMVSLGVVFLMTSCDDFLDVKPKGVKQAETVEDYAKLMNAEYMFWMSDTDSKYRSILGYMVDDASLRDTRISTAGERVYTFAKTVYDTSQEDRLWNNEYKKLYIYNTVIKEVLSSEGKEKEKKELYAQALFSRAYIYFRLVNFYAKHYTENSAELGVPLILEPNVDATNIKRATIEQVYSQIVSDLEESFKYLPNSNEDYKFNADKNSYYAMMARIYLCQGNYEKALENANKVLNSYPVLKDYSTLVDADVQAMYDALFPPNDDQTIMARMYVYGFKYNRCYVSEDLMSVYNTDANVEDDFRCQLFTKEDGSDPTKRTYNYPIEYNGGLTTPEIYLIIAECEARIGDISRAMELVNTLRKNRIKNAEVLQTNDKQKALTYVLNERRKEFAGRPEFRLIDLKRLNLNKTITHEFNGKTFTANTNTDSNYFILPIPPNVIQFNPEMKQNER